MDIGEAVNKRRSVRAFRTDAVPKQVLQEILGAALRAPSWANTQPWELAVVSGQKLETIKRAFLSRPGVRANPDFPGLEVFPEPYRSRFEGLAAGLSTIASRGEEGANGAAWYLQGPVLYGAPAAIYVYIDRSLCYQGSELNVWPVFDCGLLCENIMLLALNYHLGTIAQAQAVHYPDILRQVLELPETKLMLLGIAIGYPDTGKAINDYRSEREPVQNVVSWHGFDETG